jgi:RHS repeat-associated protein
MFSADPYANRFLYTGREFLKEANLYDYRNRVYSAELGRFFQSDPIRFDAGDLNLYRYVCNSSVIKTYPLGLEEKRCKSENWCGDVIYSVVAEVIGPGVLMEA